MPTLTLEPTIKKSDSIGLYRKMMLIRLCEERLAKSHQRGLIHGACHTYVGQEAIATGVCSQLKKEDMVFSTHRGHGHALAKGLDPQQLFAELYGRATGCSRGRGGSMHLFAPEIGMMGTSGIVGPCILQAAGAAYSFKLLKSDHISVAFFGDGAVNNGAFHEGLNMASIWKLPVLFVCENNHYATEVPFSYSAGNPNVAERGATYALPALEVDGNNVLAVQQAAREAVDRARSAGGPTLIECKTYRTRAHAEGMGDFSYRTRQEVDQWKTRCPLLFLKEYLLENQLLDVTGLADKNMVPYFDVHFGNAASRNHVFGWTAEAAVENARSQVAGLIGGDGKEIVWTSGATESNNLALKGATSFYKKQGNHVITVETEHKSVIDTCKRLQREGCDVTFLTPQKDGLVTPEMVTAAMTDKTVVVSVMLANNEIGVVQDAVAIGKAIKAKNPKTLFHIDAVQGAGKVPFSVEEAKADLVAVSAHKMYGPKGVGALWVRRKPRVRIDPMIDGGGHERGMRSGTLAVPLIVGFGKAAALAKEEMAGEAQRLASLRDRLHRGITTKLSEVYVNGSLERRLPGNLNISFAFVEGESLLMALKDVAVSSGSACTSASLEPSYVLRALGVGDDLAHTSIRFGIGRFNTEAEIDYVIDLVVKSVERLRQLSPLWEMHQEGIDINSIQWTPH